MKKYLQNKLNNEKGMTLIELLAVIVIIAIIAAIAIPAIGNIIENSRYSALKADALNVIAASQIYYTDNADQSTVTIATLKTGGYLETSGKITEGTIAKPAAGAAGTLKLTTAAAVVFSGTKSVKFTNATVELINADNAKGSTVTAGRVIGS